MKRPRRSLAAQIQEIDQTIAERRNARYPGAEYRLATLRDVATTLRWLESHADAVKTAARRSTGNDGQVVPKTPRK